MFARLPSGIRGALGPRPSRRGGPAAPGAARTPRALRALGSIQPLCPNLPGTAGGPKEQRGGCPRQHGEKQRLCGEVERSQEETRRAVHTPPKTDIADPPGLHRRRARRCRCSDAAHACGHARAARVASRARLNPLQDEAPSLTSCAKQPRRPPATSHEGQHVAQHCARSSSTSTRLSVTRPNCYKAGLSILPRSFRAVPCPHPRPQRHAHRKNACC